MTNSARKASPRRNLAASRRSSPAEEEEGTASDCGPEWVNWTARNHRTDGAAPFKFHKSKGATAKKRFPFANGGGILAFPRVIVVVAGVGGGGGGVRVGNILKADGEEEEGGARILPTSSSIVSSF